MLVDPSVERKVKLPPVQPFAPTEGQLMFTVPAGSATFELMVTPEPAAAEPPELVKPPWSAYAGRSN
jgi:hypothetical protein